MAPIGGGHLRAKRGGAGARGFGRLALQHNPPAPDQAQGGLRPRSARPRSHQERGSDTQAARALLSGPEGSPGQAAVLKWWVAASAAVRQATCQRGPGASSLASRARAARRAWWKTRSLRRLG
eukprot:scaffold8841_cov53-Phaeocystis_antarctica.AAC.2